MTEILIGGKSREITTKEKPHLGMQSVLKGRLYGDKRCMYCGDWIHWADVEPKYCFEGSVIRKLTGSGFQQCLDLFDLRCKLGTENASAVENRTVKLIGQLHKRGLIS